MVRHEFFVRDQLHREHVLVLEGPPGAVTQGGRRDNQHSLAAVHGGLSDQLAGQECLAQADLVSDQHAVALGQDALGPPKAVGLERREMDLAGPSRVRLGFGVKFGAVALPEHPQVDELRRMRFEARLEQCREVIFDGFAPQFVEPTAHLLDGVRRVVSQVQLQVGGQSGPGEVRRSGYHSVGPVAHQERLAVQEAILEPAHFHASRPQPAHQPLCGGVGLQREPQHVAFRGEIPLVVGEGLAQAGTGCPFGPGRLDAELASPVFGWCRFCAHKDPGTVESVE